jgi:hypothetical protein
MFCHAVAGATPGTSAGRLESNPALFVSIAYFEPSKPWEVPIWKSCDTFTLNSEGTPVPSTWYIFDFSSGISDILIVNEEHLICILH